MSKSAYIFDLDGTLSDPTHRLKYIKQQDPPNWDKFYEACDQDPPIQPTIDICNALAEKNFYIFIFTGRSDQVMSKTIDWLFHNEVSFDDIYMRPEGDYKPDNELKLEFIRYIQQIPIAGIFEDRKKVVNMWRNEGYLCYQTAPGNF